jgi:L-amino acid N-acyltransferase YncA
VRIRPCTEMDVSAVQAIYAHHVRTGLGTFEEVPPTVEEMRRRFAELRAQKAPYLVAELDDGRIAGYAFAGPFKPRSAYRFTCEDAVYIACDHIRRGIGKALMRELIGSCRALQLRQMLAVIGDSSNAGSIGLHRNLGFEPVGTFKQVGFKLDRWVDAVLMQLAL